MAKDRSFAAKMAKGEVESNTCSTCGETYSTLKVISSEVKDGRDSVGFKEKFVAVCKCNEKEIYG
ncbi:hypothetical protein B6I21_01000 [candidate division KSB1 bacterium 4572_119]|nr:MAG: hypothetical protein B6I21_01000 [candidate division KSB1 bacterium 4572_119]